MKYNTVHAIIESPRMQSHFTTEGLVFGPRMPDLQIRYDNFRHTEWLGCGEFSCR